MKNSTRLSLLLLSLACFWGWLTLRQPYSPTDDLEQVCYTAFTVHAPGPEAGLALARAAREWPGVRATTYNASSDLLVAIHTDETSPDLLREKLQELSSRPLSPKTFSAPAGPGCPVPHETLAALPGIFLGLGIGFICLLGAIEWRRKGRKLNITSFHQTNPSSL